jgi:hypothetical protein
MLTGFYALIRFERFTAVRKESDATVCCRFVACLQKTKNRKQKRRKNTTGKIMDKFADIFTDQVLEELFPASRADEFFEALFGDASEGAYDIKLRYNGYNEQDNTLNFNLDLVERPGCCLVCNLTYGLPEVFSRHPIININGLVADIDARLNGQAKCGDWKLGTTVQQEKSLHSIPLQIQLAG